MWLVNRRNDSGFKPSKRFARHSQAMRFARKWHKKGYSIRIGRVSRKGWRMS